ncbi:hypothetical protein HDU79_006544 [Rhizoclosmatium sp. JEL0117]|nr:hypothetical protein HDU79_006544 [Rhizoclosmatium sp. JEL0117]
MLSRLFSSSATVTSTIRRHSIIATASYTSSASAPNGSSYPTSSTSTATSSTSLSTDSSKPLEIPTPPGSEDCCMSGCAHCVWDMYNEEVEQYNAAAVERGLPLVDPNAIDPSVQAFRDMEREKLEREEANKKK